MRSIALILILAFVAAACGGSDGPDAERFCEILDELDAQDTTGLPPEEALPIIKEGRDNFAEGIKVAPEEIQADAEIVANGAIQFTDLLIEAGGDDSAVDQTAAQELVNTVFTPEFDTASQRVDAWRSTNCS
jgi:hypothetical protein